MIVSRPAAKVALSPQQTLIALLLLLMIVLNYLDRQILSVLAPVMRKEIGLTQTDYALAVNSFLLAYAFMYAGSGLILDRVGSRKGIERPLATGYVLLADHPQSRFCHCIGCKWCRGNVRLRSLRN